MADNLILEDGIHKDDPRELEYQEKMREAKKKADKMWKEDGGTAEDEDDEVS